MTDFDYEVMQKKRVANNARRRKCGSKSKKCCLPSDNMTQKQWKERCGKVMTYQIKKPMTWEEFNQLPEDLQKEYLHNLADTYAVSAVNLADMFGVIPKTVRTYCEKHNLDLGFARGKKMSKEQRIAFQRFLDGEHTVHEEPIQEPVEDPVVKAEVPVKKKAVSKNKPRVKNKVAESEPVIEPVAAAEPVVIPDVVEDVKFMPVPVVEIAPAVVSEFNIELSGGFGYDMAQKLYNTAASMLPNGTNVKVSIHCSVIEDKEQG